MRLTCPNGLDTSRDIHDALDCLPRAGAVLLFAAACLRRVWARLEHDTHREAVEATEDFARRRLSRPRMLEAWTRADHADARAIWCINGWYFEDWLGVETSIDPHTAALLTMPHQLGVNAVLHARALAGDQGEEIVAQRRLYRDIIGPPYRVTAPARYGRHVREVVAGLDRSPERL